ncbi:hypothetical protein CI610_00928 [invertebrate metagenome]|uniref:Uncharacterized protein n=1 Tax=invertebrate metagenome TaxID=1711999 RepID=A0A2H9T9Z1_9ZZZZ
MSYQQNTANRKSGTSNSYGSLILLLFFLPSLTYAAKVLIFLVDDKGDMHVIQKGFIHQKKDNTSKMDQYNLQAQYLELPEHHPFYLASHYGGATMLLDISIPQRPCTTNGRYYAELTGDIKRPLRTGTNNYDQVGCDTVNLQLIMNPNDLISAVFTLTDPTLIPHFEKEKSASLLFPFSRYATNAMFNHIASNHLKKRTTQQLTNLCTYFRYGLDSAKITSSEREINTAYDNGPILRVHKIGETQNYTTLYNPSENILFLLFPKEDNLHDIIIYTSQKTIKHDSTSCCLSMFDIGCSCYPINWFCWLCNNFCCCLCPRTRNRFLANQTDCAMENIPANPQELFQLSEETILKHKKDLDTIDNTIWEQLAEYHD